MGRVKRLRCRLLHDAYMWPINGKVICRICLEEWEVDLPVKGDVTCSCGACRKCHTRERNAKNRELEKQLTEKSDAEMDQIAAESLATKGW
jgi:hypothetical protein